MGSKGLALIHRVPSPLRVVLFLLVAATLVLAGCDGDSPSEPGHDDDDDHRGTFSLSSAQISVDGTVIPDGGTFSHASHPAGSSTRFEARLFENGQPAPNHWCDVQVEPPMGGSMTRHQFQLHDDGTQGDEMAGDGVYTLEDTTGDHGFHHADAPHGEWEYEFECHHASSGEDSNSITIHVRVQ